MSTFEPTTLRLWDWQAGKKLASTPGSHNNLVPFTGFTDDGRRIVTGSVDSTVKIWDADGGAELLTLRGHTGAINRGVILSNGLLFTSLWDGRATK